MISDNFDNFVICNDPEVGDKSSEILLGAKIIFMLIITLRKFINV
jgi:hypothetical protein